MEINVEIKHKPSQPSSPPHWGRWAKHDSCFPERGTVLHTHESWLTDGGTTAHPNPDQPHRPQHDSLLLSPQREPVGIFYYHYYYYCLQIGICYGGHIHSNVLRNRQRHVLSTWRGNRLNLWKQIHRFRKKTLFFGGGFFVKMRWFLAILKLMQQKLFFHIKNHVISSPVATFAPTKPNPMNSLLPGLSQTL